jgi:alpha-L-fucosidase
MNRRSFLRSASGALAGGWIAGRAPGFAGAPWRRAIAPPPRPSPAQLAWQRDELAIFLHFGVNTFTDREWGDGREDPAIFAPSSLDARQWARAARAAGFRAMVLTAKHHDGFCLWPTATTTHSVVRSPWRDGRGDVVREFVDACRAEGLRPGVYLSPWDRNNPAYGDSPRYNDLYAEQLTELLTRYGQLAEVWFDGANGEGPNGRRQQYDWPRVFGLVRRLQPEAVVFSDAGPDVRWCGNEAGRAGDPNWSTVDPEVVPFPGATGPRVTPALQNGDPAGTVWRPAEADVSIRPGWFYHPAQDERVRSADNLVDLYYSSVGRNSKLLLNVPPTREGLLHATDVSRLAAMHERLTAMFATDLAARATSVARKTGERTSEVEVDLGAPVTAGIARFEENIEQGQAVARYTFMGEADGQWRVLSRGTTIGYARLDRFAPTVVRRVRLVVEDAIAEPGPIRVRLFAGAG